MFPQVNDILTIILIVIVLALTIALVICMTMLIRVKNNSSEISRILFTLMKRQKISDESLNGIKHALVTIHENIGSLSTSTKQLIDDFKTINNEKNLPTPQVVNMIKDTIMEQITIETLLSRDMRVPNKKSTEYIIENTIKTYPHIDQEYLVKLCLAMIENFNISRQESSQNKKEQ